MPRKADISTFFWNILYTLPINAHSFEHHRKNTNPSFRKPPAEVDARPAGSTALCKQMPVVWFTVSSLIELLLKAEQQAVEQMLYIFAWLFLNLNTS